MSGPFKSYKILFYLLTLLLFFVIGVVLAGLAGVGKDQGLAAAAIVLGYGVASAALFLVVALVLAAKLPAGTVINLNKIFALLLLGSMAYFSWKYVERNAEKEKSTIPQKPTEINQ